MVKELFKDVSKADLKKIIEKLQIDLEMCGYDSTLETLEAQLD